MIFRFGRLQRIIRFSPSALCYSGSPFRLSAIGTNLLDAHSVEVKSGIYRRTELAGSYFRYSTVSETKHELVSAIDVLSFVQSSLHKPKSSFHYWLNDVSDCKKLFKEDGILLVLISDYVGNDFTSNQNTFKMFEKVKLLDQRYPFLQVLAVQYGRSINFTDISISLLQSIIKEYINFPILLSKKNTLEMMKGPCYIISKGFQNPLVYPAKDVDLEALDQAIQELNEQTILGAVIHDMKSTWVQPVEVVKELDVCSSSQNLLWSFPGRGFFCFLQVSSFLSIRSWRSGRSGKSINDRVHDYLASRALEDIWLLFKCVFVEGFSSTLLLFSAILLSWEDVGLFAKMLTCRNKLLHIVSNEGLELGIETVIHAKIEFINRENSHRLASHWMGKYFVVPQQQQSCVSVDECGNRLFLSDANHHRITVFNGNGKLLDAIGSSPGFEDGVFESAKLLRPAASFYHASEDSLYFVDSENHAIRRADMERRVVETVFPATADGKKNKSFWKLILDKVWPGKLKTEEFNSKSFLFPWHMLKASDSDLFVLNQRFETLWVIDLESSSIKEAVKESSKILEICGQMMLDKSISTRHVPSDWLEQQRAATCSVDGIPYAGLMSSIATFQDHIVLCDTVGQTVVKFDRGSGSATSFPFSNFEVLGLPYWFVPPLEQVYSDDGVPGLELDHIQEFNLLPGRVDIELYISVPQQTELVEQPQEGCIWRLARGAAAEVSGIENKAASTEKVGIAQQWYDELDNLCYSTPLEEESCTEEESKPVRQEGVAHIGCTINTSPGTSEVIVLAALYLRLKKSTISTIESREDKAAKIVDIIDPSKRLKRDLLIKVLTSSRDLELIFLRPLHVRLKFDSFDHPKADNLRDIIVSESSVKVQVTL